MLQREVEIINKLGLHARASAKLTQLAARFQSDVHMARTGRKVNAAARIDALSSGGMDDIEIPAFLRKQAD